MGDPEERSHKILECMLCSTARWPCVWPRFPFFNFKVSSTCGGNPVTWSPNWQLLGHSCSNLGPETPGNPRKPPETPENVAWKPRYDRSWHHQQQEHWTCAHAEACWLEPCVDLVSVAPHSCKAGGCPRHTSEVVVAR